MGTVVREHEREDHEWRRANKEIFDDMQKQRVEPDATTHNASFGACDKGKHRERALEILDDMQQPMVVPSTMMVFASSFHFLPFFPSSSSYTFLEQICAFSVWTSVSSFRSAFDIP